MKKCETTRIEKLTFGESLDRSIERVMGTTKNNKNSVNSRKKQVNQGNEVWIISIILTLLVVGSKIYVHLRGSFNTTLPPLFHRKRQGPGHIEIGKLTKFEILGVGGVNNNFIDNFIFDRKNLTFPVTAQTVSKVKKNN